jgi:hypothetical protein
MAYSLINLSASPDGSPIQITTTGFTNLTGGAAVNLQTGQTIHSGVAGTSQYDEVFLYATNRANSGVYLMLQWGAVISGDSIQTTVPPNDGLTLVSPGLVINSGSILRAYASAANHISIQGYVQRGP